MAFTIDAPTLLFSTGLGSVFATLAMGYVWYVHRREPAVRYWGSAFLAIAAGVILVALRAQLPAVWTIVVGNTLVIAGMFLMYAGTARFTRRPVAWPLAIAVIAASTVALAYWSLVTPNYVARVLVFSGGLLPAWLLMIRDLLRSGQGGMRVTYRAVAAVYGLCVIATIARAADTASDPAATQLFDGGLLQTLWLATAMAVMFFSPFGFVLMTSQRLQLRLDRLANEDELTGVLNRRAFLTRALEGLAAGAADTPATMLVLDIDHFKQLNDRHGHAAGDAVLRGFARIVAAQLRPGDLFARVGGEEFWLLLPQTDVHGAVQLAERLRAVVAAAVILHGAERLQISVSIGVGAVDRGDVSAALVAADRAMYAAKAQGRNRVVTA